MMANKQHTNINQTNKKQQHTKLQSIRNIETKSMNHLDEVEANVFVEGVEDEGGQSTVTPSTVDEEKPLQETELENEFKKK